MDIFDSRNSWADIDSHSIPANGLNWKRIRSSAQLEQFLAIDASHQYLYLLRLPSDVNENDQPQDILGCCSRFLKLDGEIYFALILKDNRDWCIFKLLCQILVTELEKLSSFTSDNLLLNLIKILKRCSAFFKRKNSTFQRSQAIGLLGELYFLENHVIPNVGWTHALSCWKGPSGAPQDFSMSDNIIEIKCTESANKFSVHISNAEQLSPTVGNGYLYVLTVSSGTSPSDSHTTLHETIRRISAAFIQKTGDSELFKSLLGLVGYDEKSPESIKPYLFLESSIYELRENFPRISSAMLANGAITSVKYTINLLSCINFKTTPNWINNDKLLS